MGNLIRRSCHLNGGLATSLSVQASRRRLLNRSRPRNFGSCATVEQRLLPGTQLDFGFDHALPCMCGMAFVMDMRTFDIDGDPFRC